MDHVLLFFWKTITFFGFTVLHAQHFFFLFQSHPFTGLPSFSQPAPPVHPVVPAAPQPVAPTQPSSGGSLDSMLGLLQSDLSRQGVQTSSKGNCSACQKPVVGQVSHQDDTPLWPSHDFVSLDASVVWTPASTSSLVCLVPPIQPLFISRQKVLKWWMLLREDRAGEQTWKKVWVAFFLFNFNEWWKS